MGHHTLDRKGPLAALVFAVTTITPTGVASAATGGAAAGEEPAAPRVVADFNGDFQPDLAVGVPFESVGDIGGAGAVNVLYSTGGGGPSGASSQLITQNTAGVGSDAETGDHFGAALAVGDFNADTFADLAVGAPDEAVGSLAGAGAVNVLYGSPNGLVAAASKLFTQDNVGVARRAAAGDRFGAALAAGDLDARAANAELAIGAPGATAYGQTDAGLVNVLYGATGGLGTGRAPQVITQNTAGVGSDAEADDRFGAALAIGQSDVADPALAVGVPGEAVGDVVAAGTVNVLFGTPAGLSGTGSAMFHQGVTGIGSDPETGDLFGGVLAMGDFDADGGDDLAVGVEGESVGIVAGAGAVNVIYTGPHGFNTGRASQLFTQATTGLGSDPEPFDGFGFALTAGDYDRSFPSVDDLAIGAPGESVGTIDGAGAVNVVYGTVGQGLNAGRASQLLTQGTGGVAGDPEPFDNFGRALASADFNATDGPADLVVGVPGESVGTVQAAGAINVFPGTTGGLTGMGSKVFHQGVAGIGSDPETGDSFGAALGAPAFGTLNGPMSRAVSADVRLAGS